MTQSVSLLDVANLGLQLKETLGARIFLLAWGSIAACEELHVAPSSSHQVPSLSQAGRSRRKILGEALVSSVLILSALAALRQDFRLLPVQSLVFRQYKKAQ